MKDATNVVAGKPDDMNATIPFENDDPPTPNIRENLQCELETIRCSLPPGSLSMKLGGSGPIRNDACHTPPKRIRKEVVLTPGSDEEDHELGTKRPKDTPILSYTDSNGAPGFELPSSQLGFLNPDDIDGVPIDAGLPVVKAEKRSTQIAISTRPLIRRATDFPLPPPSPTQTYAPSPRSAEIILKKVLGIPEPSSDPVAAWRRQRDNHLCPLCLGVLVRPVDVAGCGHFVCRTHVLDIYQHGGSREGIRCCVCRKEEKVEDFNKVEIDQRMWSKILRSKFHPSQRRSVSPSRSLTPLRDRFNRKFFKCEEDF